jgi:hypothetical protein
MGLDHNSNINVAYRYCGKWQTLLCHGEIFCILLFQNSSNSESAYPAAGWRLAQLSPRSFRRNYIHVPNPKICLVEAAPFNPNTINPVVESIYQWLVLE